MENTQNDIRLIFYSERPDVCCEIFDKGRHRFYVNRFWLEKDEGLNVARLIAGGCEEEAIRDALIYNRIRIFATRPLADRVAEMIEELDGYVQYNVASLFRAMILWGRQAGVYLDYYHPVDFAKTICRLDDKTILSIYSIGKKKLEWVHQIQGILRVYDLESFMDGCKTVY